MILQKWNYEKHGYEHLLVPNEWNCKPHSEDMEEVINCPHCGKKLKFGESYTSMEIQTLIYGFGFGVCEECYEEEWKRRKKYKAD